MSTLSDPVVAARKGPLRLPEQSRAELRLPVGSPWTPATDYRSLKSGPFVRVRFSS
jgi:hypothetical protein